ncbi:MAG TPA: C4-type zinc ribbon domain-containing protein [Acidimicrobiales bacterium]|nr:C4-type zinc ribbon domain-containing protein [Acidimicrobiales bacterium]
MTDAPEDAPEDAPGVVPEDAPEDAPSGPPPGGRSFLDALLEVQDMDTGIAQLEHRRAALPERQELSRLTDALKEAGRRYAEVQGARGELAGRQQELENEIAATSTRREALEQRMYAARGTPARDLQAMDDEIRHLRARRDELEDAELEVMVELEPLDSTSASLEAEGRALRAAAEQQRDALAAAETDIDAQLGTLVAARAALAGTLPGDLRDRYESLRTRLGGTGAARLAGNRCSGCHLELPSMEVDRIRHLPVGTVVTCEQCGRILVPAPAPVPVPAPAPAPPG